MREGGCFVHVGEYPFAAATGIYAYQQGNGPWCVVNAKFKRFLKPDQKAKGRSAYSGSRWTSEAKALAFATHTAARGKGELATRG